MLKPKFAYTSLFTSETFGADTMTRECVHLGNDAFWYTTSHEYYLGSLCNFYDRMEEDKPNGLFTMTFDGVAHPITIELIRQAMGWLMGGQLSNSQVFTGFGYFVS